MIELLSDPNTYISLLTLTAMEIVLGIDNLVFISIVSQRLPKEQQSKARTIGLALALLFRVILLMLISWIIGLTAPLFTVLNHAVSGRDLILLGGGLFLIAKSTTEIHHKIEGGSGSSKTAQGATFLGIITQIVLLDIVFSFDSVITAVGLVQSIPIMVIAVIISMIVMLIFAGSISNFIARHPTVKMLALAFLLMIGTLLFAEGFHFEVPKGYVYFAMAFSIFVEVLNIKVRSQGTHHATQPGSH